MPKGVAPVGRANGDWGSSLKRPPETANALTFAVAASTTYRVLPSAERRASNGRMPAPLLNAVLVTRLKEPSAWMRYDEMVVLAVFTVQRYRPSCEISTQHGAVWPSAKGEDPIELSAPPPVTLNADTVPLPAPACALETYRCAGFTGENSLPNGPSDWAGNG